jgi:hypothetical protein
MNIPLPALFGRSFGEITQAYFNGIGGVLSPLFHICGLMAIILVLINGQKFKKTFTLYFLINYIWVFLYAGIVMSALFYEKMGIAFLAFWGPIPILLLFIVYRWIMELKQQRNDLVFASVSAHRFLVIPIMLFGFWYPTFVWGSGFKFVPADFLFSAFGLMPCPTTMVVLGLLTLKYPNVNKGLVYAMTLFAVMVGTAQIAIGYVPDYPLAVIGYYSLILIITDKLRGARAFAAQKTNHETFGRAPKK